MSEQRRVAVGHRDYWIATDADYGKHLGERFEPQTAALLEALSEPDSRILDVGANIGVTALLFGALTPSGRVAAVEPVPAAFSLLEQNVGGARCPNVSLHNFALGNATGTVRMQGNPDNLSGSFIADLHAIDDAHHFTQEVPVHRLDDIFPRLGLDRLDLLKVDVEGYELDVLAGARHTLATHQPVVVLEMNYVALNLWRRMSLPEFREQLLAMFPHVFAVQDGRWADFRDRQHAHEIQFSHLTQWAYMDIVAGFDEQMLRSRLARVGDCRRRLDATYSVQSELHRHVADLETRVAGLEAELAARDRLVADHAAAAANLSHQLHVASRRAQELEESTSWRVTAPLRAIKRVLG